MLTDLEVRQLCESLGCPPEAVSLIQAIRAAPPSRRVSSRAGNVSVRYPSRKMGGIIQAESHRNEFAGIYTMEHDPQTLAYYDQPPPIKLSYLGRHGRRVGVLHTPDFFVMRTDSIGWEEWKLESELERLTDSMPHRNVRSAMGNWSCPPGEHYAAPFGLVYRVRSSAEINWTLQRNIQFLADYLHPDCPPLDDAIQFAVVTLVAQNPGILLVDLLDRLADVSSDQIYTLLATTHLFVNLPSVPLAEPERVPVFRDAASAQAAALLARSSVRYAHDIANSHGLMDHPLPTPTDPPTRPPPAALDAHERVARASPAALAEANRRYALIAPLLQGQPPTDSATPARTIRFWLAAYRTAEACQGAGYLGLLPRWTERGNRTPRLPAATQNLLTQTLTTFYETPTQPRKLAVYGRLLQACAEQGILAPSYTTFAAAVRRRPQYEQTVKRQGPRAAYPQEPIYWELTLTTPRHGDRPFEIVHLDHTELDSELICSRTGRPLGRPWATFLVDAFSRRLLALTLSFDPPSYRACMRILRRCVQRHGRLPQILVVDGGKEFASVYLETLLARYEVSKKTRPGAKPRFGRSLSAYLERPTRSFSTT
jgi:hypothetical protein